MPIFSHAPTYNLKVVLQETGIKADTLRAWERRYGLPQPARSAGKHRLYSQQDIETIKWLLARQGEGLSISRAAHLWHSLTNAGTDPLQTMPIQKTADFAPTTNQTVLAQLREGWLDACMQFDEVACERVMSQALAVYPAEMVCIEILQQGLARIGELWYQNQATVQQEHFASALAIRRLDTLLSAAPPPNRPDRILVCCPPDEDHTFMPLLFTLMLRYRGWDVVYLGSNVPLTHLESTIRVTHPSLIVLTAQRLHTAAKVKEVAEKIRPFPTSLAFGGRIFNHLPAIQQHIPGHFLGKHLNQAIERVSHILAFSPPAPLVIPIPAKYTETLTHYRLQQSAIEAKVWELSQPYMPYEQVTNANLHLSQDISAALSLGDLSLLDSGIAWTEKLLLNYEMPINILNHYLKAYYQAAQMVLNEPNNPIVAWLADLVNS